ncbi:MAG: response regulator transcription factor [Pyrinomonadaceae bacterium]|nr:response regulator transcription factor [Pyrinomonadaceae bacterium]
MAKLQIETLDPIRVLVVGEHKLTRAGIRLLLERLSGVEVIAEASDCLEALSLVDKHAPQVVIIDLSVPNLTALQAIEQLAKSHPDVKVIILSIYADQESVRQALRAGVADYLFDGTSIEELEVAVRSVARGKTLLSPQVSKPRRTENRRRTGGQRPAQILSARQKQVLELIAQGKNAKEIAVILNIGLKTVETHRAQLMERLDTHEVAGLVRYAIKIGLAKID